MFWWERAELNRVFKGMGVMFLGFLLNVGIFILGFKLQNGKKLL